MPTEARDEELVRDVADRAPDALTPLYTRYAPLVFHIASQSLDPAAAEDIVQDVFLAVWRKAATFDPRRGRFRPWLMQIAHFRILNELRRRSHRPQLDPDVGDSVLEELPDERSEPAEQAWRTYRQEAVRAAVDRLPPAQRQALSLAFFEELTHDQVAGALKLPLGTVKTRIRSGIRRLRFLLAPLGAAAVLVAVLAGLGVRLHQQAVTADRGSRALAFVTASDITTVHLGPAPGAPRETHGNYRGRPGTPLAVMALHNLPPLPAGKTYQAFILVRGTWTGVGTARPDASGNALLIGEGPAFTALPDAVRVTVEPAGGSHSPTGTAVIEWKKE